MYFLIFKEKLTLFTNKYSENITKSNTGKSSVWINPGIKSKCGIIGIKKRKYNGEKLLSVFIYNPHHFKFYPKNTYK